MDTAACPPQPVGAVLRGKDRGGLLASAPSPPLAGPDFEDAALTEDERLDRLDKVLRHETALQRQIDTAVKLLARDVPQLYSRRLRDQVLQDLHITERECRDEPETDLGVSLEVSSRLYRLRKATT